MPRKISQKFSSASYSIQKFSQKIAKYRPSSLLIAVVIMGVSIFLLGGGVYDILKSGEIRSIVPLGQGRFITYLPYQIHDQVLMGSIGVMIIYVLGALGLLLIYYSTKYIRNPRQVSLLVEVGVALLLISFVSVEVVLFWIIHFPT